MVIHPGAKAESVQVCVGVRVGCVGVSGYVGVGVGVWVCAEPISQFVNGESP